MSTSIEYETDYYSWTSHQSKFLENKEFSKLDIKNLIEEIRDLGISQENKLESYICNLLMHKLKIKYQPGMHTKSWDLSIKTSSHHIQKTLKKNPGLKNKLKEIFLDAYFSARLSAAQETSLDEDVFPEESPWTVNEIFPDIEEKYW